MSQADGRERKSEKKRGRVRHPGTYTTAPKHQSVTQGSQGPIEIAKLRLCRSHQPNHLLHRKMSSQSTFHTWYGAQVARRAEAGENHVIRMNVTSAVHFLFRPPSLTCFAGWCCSDPNHPRRHRFRIMLHFASAVDDHEMDIAHAVRER